MGSNLCLSNMVIINVMFVLFVMLSKSGLVNGFLNNVCMIVLEMVRLVFIINIVNVWGKCNC